MIYLGMPEAKAIVWDIVKHKFMHILTLRNESMGSKRD